MANDNVIYISSHGIQWIVGSCDKSDMIKIQSFKEVKLEEGTMINGVITDEMEVTNQLKVIHESGVKSARLLIDSGQVLVKNVEVPALKQKELLQVVKDELSNLEEGYEDLVYDYSVLKREFEEEKAGGEILCCAAERKLLTNYIEVFENAGIKLESIDVSVNALHKLTGELSDLEKKTYIVSVLDSNNVSSYLFENNKYKFSNRARLFSERGSKEFVAEMNSNISQLIQFNKSQHSPYSIEVAYFCSLHEDEADPVFENIRENLEIGANIFPDSKIVYVTDKSKEKEFTLNNYVYSVGCLIRK